jgi:hypothetical protein
MMQDANKYMDDIFRFYAFFDKLSYKILCILSYGLKDMNYARFKYLQGFSGEKKQNWAGPEPEWRWQQLSHVSNR